MRGKGGGGEEGGMPVYMHVTITISVLTSSPASSMLPCTTPTAVFFSAERREGERERGRKGGREGVERGVLVGRMRTGKKCNGNSHAHVYM